MSTRVQFITLGSWLQSLRNVHNGVPHARTGQTLCCKELTTVFLKQWLPITCQNSFRMNSTDSSQKNSAITEAKDTEQSHLTIGEKVKQTTKDASYLGVIIAGIGVTGIMFYAILRELFSGHSPNSVYSDALRLCRKNPQVVNAVGEPVKGYGELSARGRRRYVSHMEYEKDGVNYMRMKFYIEGSRRKGNVHLEVKENNRGKYEYRYLFVDIDGYPKDTIVLEDNRYLDNSLDV